MTRQEAIKYLTEWNNAIIDRGDTLNSHAVQALIMAIEAIEAIEALEKEPKRGKWILDEEESKKHIEPIYICSACKNYEAWGNTEKTPFCPNCGARMESDNE